MADEKRNTANDTQYYYDVKNEKVLMIFDGMVDGEDNPELIEKILVMHGKQQQKQQENRKCNLKLFLEWSRYDRGKKIFDIVILLSAS